MKISRYEKLDSGSLISKFLKFPWEVELQLIGGKKKCWKIQSEWKLDSDFVFYWATTNGIYFIVTFLYNRTKQIRASIFPGFSSILEHLKVSVHLTVKILRFFFYLFINSFNFFSYLLRCRQWIQMKEYEILFYVVENTLAHKQQNIISAVSFENVRIATFILIAARNRMFISRINVPLLFTLIVDIIFITRKVIVWTLRKISRSTKF